MKIRKMYKIILSVALLAALALNFSGCAERINNSETGKKQFENHIDFSLNWNILGKSFYDSKTGILIKTDDVIERAPEDYRTELKLSESQRNRIDDILKNLDIESYPDEFDPYKAGDECLTSSPSRDLILKVGEKTVSCKEIALYGSSQSERGQKFLNAVEEIIDIITSTPEWQALPDYEVLYD